MKKKILALLILISIIFFTSGCHSYRELNDLAIATAISIDYIEETKEYKVIVQVVNTVKQQDASSSGEPAFINFTSTSSSIQEALRKMVLESPRKIYGSQIQLIILSENVTTHHLDEVLDFFTRNHEIRSELKIAIAQNNEDLNAITIQTLLDNLSSSNILSSLKLSSEKEGISEMVTLNDLTNMYLNPYQELILPSIIIEGDLEDGINKDNKTSTVYKSSAKISTTGIFKDEQLLEYLDENNSKYLSIIRGNIKNYIIKYDFKDGYVVFEPNNIKVKLSADVKKNKVTLSLEGFTRVYEITSDYDIQDNKNAKKLQEYFNKKTEEEILNTFNYIRNNYNTDVFKFRDLYYKTDPNYLKKINNNWYTEIFPNLELEVKSNIKLYEKGHTKEAIKYERKNK